MSLWSALKSVVNTIKSAVSSLVEKAETRNDEIEVKNVKVVKSFVFDVEILDVPNDDGLKKVHKDDVKDIITLTEDAEFELDIRRFAQFGKEKKKWHDAKMYVKFDKGFTTNGTSAPKFFELQIPAYIAKEEENADIYNAAAFIHDGLYACKGEIQEVGKLNKENEKRRYTLTRKECDNLLYGIWKSSTYVSSLTAKVAEFGVRLAAGGPEHWDNDDLHCKDLISIKIKYIE